MVKTLGQGLNAKVKLARNQTGELFACKITKIGSNTDFEQNKEAF